MNVNLDLAQCLYVIKYVVWLGMYLLSAHKKNQISVNNKPVLVGSILPNVYDIHGSKIS
jgi:hypothetical protein